MLPSPNRAGREIIDPDPRLERRCATRSRNRIIFSVGYVLVGVTSLVLALTAPSSRSVFLFGFAGIGIFGGIGYYFAVGYDLAHSIESVIVGEAGVQLRRRNGELLLASWTDPELNLTVWERRYPSLAAPVCTLHCKLKGRTSRAAITNEGAALMGQEATKRGLQVDLKLDRTGNVTRIRAKAREDV